MNIVRMVSWHPRTDDVEIHVAVACLPSFQQRPVLCRFRRRPLIASLTCGPITVASGTHLKQTRGTNYRKTPASRSRFSDRRRSAAIGDSNRRGYSLLNPQITHFDGCGSSDNALLFESMERR